MVSIPKIIGVISCGVVLSLSLASVTQAFERNLCATRKGGLPNLVACSKEKQQGIQTLKGKVLRVDGDTLLVEWFNGKEAQLHLGPSLKEGNKFTPGEQIEVKVADRDHEETVLSIHEIK